MRRLTPLPTTSSQRPSAAVAQPHVAGLRGTPSWPNAPAEFVAQPEFDASGKLIGIDDNEKWVVTPDGTRQHRRRLLLPAPRLAARRSTSAADLAADHRRLAQRSRDHVVRIQWRLAGRAGWSRRPAAALRGRAADCLARLLQALWARYAGPRGLKDAEEFVPALINGTLDAVTILKPSPSFDEHPGYSVLQQAEEHAVLLI